MRESNESNIGMLRLLLLGPKRENYTPPHPSDCSLASPTTSSPFRPLDSLTVLLSLPVSSSSGCWPTSVPLFSSPFRDSQSSDSSGSSKRREHSIQVEWSWFRECAKHGIEFTSALSPALFPLIGHPSICHFLIICPSSQPSVQQSFDFSKGLDNISNSACSAHADKYLTRDFDSGRLRELFLCVISFCSARFFLPVLCSFLTFNNLKHPSPSGVTHWLIHRFNDWFSRYSLPLSRYTWVIWVQLSRLLYLLLYLWMLAVRTILSFVEQSQCGY